MSITDELRFNIEGAEQLYGCECKHLLAIADRIDAKHEQQLGVLYRDMSDAEWVRLPVDPDNVPWNPGDCDEDGNVVIELRLTSDGWFVITDGEWPYRPESKRHYHDHHTSNVEDVLCDLLNEYRENECTLEEARLSEYAAKLRLVEGED